MVGNCSACPLPGYIQSVTGARNAAQAAEANVRASESPTQARSYEEARDSALAQLRDSQVQYTQFINSWRGVCSELGGKKCEYGA